MRDVLFHQVAEWEREDAGPRFVWVWIAFDDRLVATGEYEGPDNHAGVWSASAFLDTWADRVDDPAARWLAPHVHRMARGEDVREAVLVGYVERYGHPPETTVWNLPATIGGMTSSVTWALARRGVVPPRRRSPGAEPPPASRPALRP